MLDHYTCPINIIRKFNPILYFKHISFNNRLSERNELEINADICSGIFLRKILINVFIVARTSNFFYLNKKISYTFSRMDTNIF